MAIRKFKPYTPGTRQRVVTDFSEIINGLLRLGIEKTEKVLVILDSPSDVIKKSINNIKKVKLIAADQLNVFDILNANKLVIGQSAINKIQEVYAS